MPTEQTDLLREFREINDYRHFNVKQEMDKSISVLKGIITGIGIDSLINDNELDELEHWCSSQPFAGKEPFRSLIITVQIAIGDGKITKDEFDDIVWACDNALVVNEKFDAITQSIQCLHGIMHGILADDLIRDQEIIELKKWVNNCDFLKGTYPYDELENILISILQDKKISYDEKNILKVFFSEFIDTTLSLNINKPDMEKLKNKYCVSGLCSIAPEIKFDNHVFCFTGKSSKCTRHEIAAKVEELSGIFTGSISSHVDYLIIGNDGNPCFAYSCYGRKVETAVEIRKNGGKTILVHENDFWDAVTDYE